MQDGNFKPRHVVRGGSPAAAGNLVTRIQKFGVDHETGLVLVIKTRALGNDGEAVINLRPRHARSPQNVLADHIDYFSLEAPSMTQPITVNS